MFNFILSGRRVFGRLVVRSRLGREEWSRVVGKFSLKLPAKRCCGPRLCVETGAPAGEISCLPEAGMAVLNIQGSDVNSLGIQNTVDH
jgi:hypothetical protein